MFGTIKKQNKSSVNTNKLFENFQPLHCERFKLLKVLNIHGVKKIS